MRDAILFVENTMVCRLHREAVTRAARARGLATLLICAPDMPLPPDGLYDAVRTTTDWTRAALEQACRDFSTHYTLRAVLNIPRFFSPDGFVAAAVAEVAQAHGWKHPSAHSLMRSVNKYLMRDTVRAAGVPTVDFALIADPAELLPAAHRIGYPVVLKPLTGGNSHLILQCTDDASLQHNFALARERLPRSAFRTLYAHPHTVADASGAHITFDPLTCMLMESYLDGPEVSVECVATTDRVVPLIVHDKLQITEASRVTYENLLVTPPVRFTSAEVAAITRYAVAVAEALHLRHCFLHVELRWDRATGPQLLEINPRIGGGKIPESLRTLRGIDVHQAELDLAMGTFALPAAPPVPAGYHGMGFLFPPHAGLLTGVSGLDTARALPGMLDVEQQYATGTRIHGDDEECFLIQCWMRGHTTQQIVDTYAKACEAISITVERP